MLERLSIAVSNGDDATIAVEHANLDDAATRVSSAAAEVGTGIEKGNSDGKLSGNNKDAAVRSAAVNRSPTRYPVDSTAEAIRSSALAVVSFASAADSVVIDIRFRST